MSPFPANLTRLGTWLRRSAFMFGALFGGLLLLLIITANRGDASLYLPKPGEAVVDVYVVDHGYHVGLIVPVNAMNDTALQNTDDGALAAGRRFADHRYLEIGWGDEGFYRHVPTIDRIEWGLAAAALFNVSRPPVLHVVGFDPEPQDAFPHSTVVHLALSGRGFARLVSAVSDTFVLNAAREPLDLGPGLYGDSEFYRATGLYNGLNDCNQWVARRLAFAGVPASQSTSTLPFGLMTELRWRAGADPRPSR